jgi:glycosyltransferase involved in cell wall biosynthesis
MPGQPLDRLLLNKWLVHAVGKKNIFFMNEECRLSHSRKWGADLSSSPVIALPIDQHTPIWHPSSKPCLRLVSVGRLVDFKAYNVGAARIVKSCLERGIDVSWDIYGNGPLENQIAVFTKELGVSQQVRLAGKLDYKLFATTVASHDVFIGMGTAVIEAAAAGVPSICAIVEEETRSYGYVSDLPFGNVGEVIEGRPMMEIADLLCAYATLSTAERVQLSAKEVAAARLYRMPAFIHSIFDMAVAYRPAMTRIGRHAIAKFYYLMTEGPMARLLFGRGLKTRLIKMMK